MPLNTQENRAMKSMNIVFFMRKWKSAGIFFLLTAFLCLCACEKVVVTESKNGITASTLPGTGYGVVVLSENGSLILLGHLLFDEIQGDNISGRWCMETWGEQPAFSTLPVNTGEGFPDAVDLESYTGQVFGDMIIIKLYLPDSEESLGIVIEEQIDEELFGTATLLPNKAFQGSIKAILLSQVDD